MRWCWVAVGLVCLLCLGSYPAEAHQPRLVTGGDVVEISNPELSQAFYATLAGMPAAYQIRAEVPFLLYLAILVPDLPDRRTDFVVEVFAASEQNRRFIVLEGCAHDWTPFYEPFAGDNYYQGPEHEQSLSAGVYDIRVSNPDNAGKYVLCVGRRESFTLAEAAETIQRLPLVKRFFGKSPWSALFNLVGLFLLLGAVGVTLLVFAALRLVRRALKRRRIEP